MTQINIQFTLFSAFYSPLISAMSGDFLAEEGLEPNWIPTGEDFFLMFRIYGPEEAAFDKTWQLGEIDKVK